MTGVSLGRTFLFKKALSNIYGPVHHRVSGRARPAECFQGRRPGLREVSPGRKAFRFHPRIIQVDERVMHHVQGVGDVAQETAYFIRIGICNLPEAPKRRMSGKIPRSTLFHRGCSSRKHFVLPAGERPAEWQGTDCITRKNFDVERLEQPEQEQPG